MPHYGFSLLEVVLALAILTTVLLACGRIVDIGIKSASDGRDLSEGQRLCESLMDGVDAGLIDARGAGQGPIHQAWGNSGLVSDPLVDLDEQRWVYSLVSRDLEFEGLLEVKITVGLAGQPVNGPEFTLVRWMRDPAVKEQEMADEQEAAENE